MALRQIFRTTHRMLVVDSCVLTDFLLIDRPRHAQARRLWDYLSETPITLKLPAHAMLEMISAGNDETRKAKAAGRFALAADTQNKPVDAIYVPIDTEFIHKYVDIRIPYLRAGDYPFVAIANRDGLPLITEDKDQRAAAEAVGVQVFGIQEFLASIGR